MAKITWARVDYRLIHGQVITKWSKIASANEIIIVDDMLGQDEFMASIYKMAAPSGVNVDIKTAADAAAAYQAGTLGTGNIFLLFKDVHAARASHEAGLAFETLQLGGIPAEAGRKVVFPAVAFGPSEAEDVRALHDAGVNIEIQVVPEEAGISYEEAMRKYES